MPYVNVQITAGASRQQKADLVKEFTESLARILGKKPDSRIMQFESRKKGKF